MIELDPRTEALLEEVRSLGRTHIRPMGLEADRTATPPPVDHEFYLICTRKGGIVSRLIGDEEGPTALEWKPVRNFLVGEETAMGFQFDFSSDRLVIDAKTPMDLPSGGGFGPTIELPDGMLITVYSYRGTDDKTRLEAARWHLPEAR